MKARNERELFNEWREGKNKLRDKKKGTRRKGQGELGKRRKGKEVRDEEKGTRSKG